MLRFLLFVIGFYLLFRIIQGVLRYLARWKRERFRSDEMPPRPPKEEPPQYRDVKDATFKDLPGDKSEPT